MTKMVLILLILFPATIFSQDSGLSLESLEKKSNLQATQPAIEVLDSIAAFNFLSRTGQPSALVVISEWEQSSGQGGNWGESKERKSAFDSVWRKHKLFQYNEKKHGTQIAVLNQAQKDFYLIAQNELTQELMRRGFRIVASTSGPMAKSLDDLAYSARTGVGAQPNPVQDRPAPAYQALVVLDITQLEPQISYKSGDNSFTKGLSSWIRSKNPRSPWGSMVDDIRRYQKIQILFQTKVSVSLYVYSSDTVIAFVGFGESIAHDLVTVESNRFLGSKKISAADQKIRNSMAEAIRIAAAGNGQ